MGIGIGLILEHTDEDGLGHDLSVSLDSVRFMNPEIIFYALLPILIFESAFFTDVHIFLREMWQVMVLKKNADIFLLSPLPPFLLLFPSLMFSSPSLFFSLLVVLPLFLAFSFFSLL